MALKTITIDNFSGGKNSYQLQTTIQNNECASGSNNVWAPLGALTKVPGYSATQNGFGTATSTAMGSIYADPVINSSYKTYQYLNVTGGGNSNLYYPFGDNAVIFGYTTGTVSVSGASLISATGNGTTWTAHVSANDMFVPNVADGTTWRQVSSVEDDTHLTLQSAIAVAMATGSTYRTSPALSYQDISWVTFNGSWWTSTTGDILHRFDGTGMTRIKSAPKAAFLAVHKNYLFAARTSTAESRIYWSAIKDSTSWPTNNFIDIDVLKGKISGIISYGNELIIFKSYGIYKLLGDIFDPSNPQYYVIPITVPKYFSHNSPFGMTVYPGSSFRALYEQQQSGVLPGGLYFYAFGQIYRYIEGTSYITRISAKFQGDLPNTFGSILDSSPSNIPGAASNADQRIYMTSFNDNLLINGLTTTGNAQPNAGIIDKNGAWWQVKGTEPSNKAQSSPLYGLPMLVLPGNNNTKPQLLISSKFNPTVVIWDFLGFPNYDTNFYAPESAASSAIAATWVSKEFNIEYGTFKWIIIYLQKQTAGNLTVQWSIDQAANVSYTLDMTTGRGQVIRAVIPINQKGTTIQLTLSNSTLSQTFNIYAVKLIYEESPMERLL